MENKKSVHYFKCITAGMLAYSISIYSHSNNLYQTSLQTENLFQLEKHSQASDYLVQILDKKGYNASQFHLQSVKESLTAKHYHFQQYENGIPIDNASITLSISSSDGSLLKSYSHLINTPNINNKEALFSKTSDESIQIAWDNLNVSGKLKTSPISEQVWLPTKEGLVAVYRVSMSVSNPVGDWVQYIDAQSGKVLKLEQRAIFEKQYSSQVEYKPDHFATLKESSKTISQALNELNQKNNLQKLTASLKSTLATGSAQVFDPDPKTTLNNDTLKDTTADSEFDDAYYTYSLPEVSLIEDMYHLESPWVKITDFDSPNVAPVVSENAQWLFKRGNNGFDDANVFYHLDSSQRYIQSLGFKEDTGIQYGAISADSNGANGADNSYFSILTNSVAFGHGGVNDGEDADVILHEYGHAINHDINPNWSGADTGGMGEGFGDYWAGSYSLSTANGDTFFPNRVFTWDGHNEFWAGRILNDVDAQYNPNLSYPAHANVDGVLSDQLWSTPLFQSLLQLIEMGYSREEVDTTVLESQFGLGGGLTMRMMAQSTVQAAAKLYPLGPHAGVFYSNFIRHNILAPKLNSTALSVRAGRNGTIDPGEVVSIKIPLLNNGIVAEDVTGKISIPELFSQSRVTNLSSPYGDVQTGKTVTNFKTFRFKVPADTKCGTPFDLTFNYEATIYNTLINHEKTFNMVIGKILTDSHLQDTSVSIPDNGPEIFSALEINQDNKLVKNLRVRVNISHTFIGDLVVGLESPQGTRVILHSRTGGSTDDIQLTYPDEAAPAQSLSILNGEAISGEWKLFVQDQVGLDTGEVIEWELFYDHDAVCE